MQRHPIRTAATIVLLMLCAASLAFAQAGKPRPQAPIPQCNPATFRVIVDVGHTPESPGAVSARGVDEYEFNLRLAKVIDAKLREAGFNRAHLLLASGDKAGALAEFKKTLELQPNNRQAQQRIREIGGN